MSETEVIGQVVAQTITGLGGGALIEYFFPKPESVSNSNALRVSMEILGQLGVNAFATWKGFEMLYRQNIISGTDPSGRISYFLALAAAQDGLMTKMKNMKGFINSKLAGFYIMSGSRPEVSGVTQPTNMDFTSRFTHETDLNHQMSDFDPLQDE
jgi:hypothetical protein